MKQLWQGIATGGASVVEVPAPVAGKGQILVRVMASLISAGTERSVVEFAEKNLIQKAMARPDLVKQLADKGRREGWLTAMQAAKGRLNSEMVLGYSNAGVVVEVGEGVTEFKVGDRVACAGGGYASHSELVRVPRNLAAIIPSHMQREVSFEEAAFATVAAIGLQGIRLAELQIGEVVAVIGLGLIGQITAQLARAHGCTVIGMDLSSERCALAERMGCASTATSNEQMSSAVAAVSNGSGADCVLISAATKSSAPVSLAAEIARDRARIVAIGDVGMQLPRKPYYMKELDFRISRSYGPGRYDPDYEEKGRDYPIGYVRWTEGRNLQAVLHLLSTGQLNVTSLITHRFPIEYAAKGYDLISGKINESFLGVTITYENEPTRTTRVELNAPDASQPPQKSGVRLGMLGAGNFAGATLLPAIKRIEDISLIGICAPGGTSARSLGAQLGFRYCTSSETELLADDSINIVAISTRHSDHARQVIAALEAGKHVFCEKPLAMSASELASILRVYEQKRLRQTLTVGYNRRFAPLAKQLKAFVAGTKEPFAMNYRVNAGFIPGDHWVQDSEVGGGRIIGEVCHFVDFLSFVCGQPVVSVSASVMNNAGRYSNDNLAALLHFADGSLGTISYLANGDKAFSKERVEVFVQGRVAILEDFRMLETVRNGKRSVVKSRLRIDKGHFGEWAAIVAAMKGGTSGPISIAELTNSTLATLALIQSSVERRPVRVDSSEFYDRVRQACSTGLQQCTTTPQET